MGTKRQWMLQQINKIMVTKQWYKNVFSNNEGKSLGHEQFIRILRNKIYKYMTSL